MFSFSPLRSSLRTSSGVKWSGDTTRDGVVRLMIAATDTPNSLRDRHRAEAAFYSGHDPEKVLEHLLAAAHLPVQDAGTVWRWGRPMQNWADTNRQYKRMPLS
jgi:hypothetical protein